MSNCIPMVFIWLEKNCNFSQLTFKAMQHFFAITPYCPCNTVIMLSIESNYTLCKFVCIFTIFTWARNISHFSYHSHKL